MMKLKHKSLITIAGLSWLAIGIFLLSMGLRLIVTKASDYEFGGLSDSSLLSFVAPISGGFQQAGMILVAVALFIGYFKSRFVLAKTVKRMVTRIRHLQQPAPVYKLYSLSFYVVIAAMMGLGVLMRTTGIPNDIRGLIDVAVGSALINGSLLYFKNAFSVQSA